ncbi:MAG: DUF4124 domain-containing protein [Pseudomonadota bacterium]
MRILFTCLLLSLALPAGAQIYTYTDAKGNKVYTNQPPDGVEVKALDLPEINSVPMPVPPADNGSATNPAAGAAAIYSTLQLADLPTEEAIRANNGTFSVTINVAPALKPGHLLQLMLDGQPYGQPSPGQRLQMENIDRGEHSLMVQVLSGGKPIQQSQAVNFAMQRVNTGNAPPVAAPKPKPKTAP